MKGPQSRIATLLLLLIAPAAAVCAEFACQVDDPVYPDALFPVVVFETSEGTFEVELNRRRAPVTVNNFLRYVKDRAYDNTLFHRVIDQFVVQGGGYHRDLSEVEELGAIVNESGNGLANEARTIAMARLDDPHSAGSQFYFNMIDNESLNPGRRNWGYTVFGLVIEGWEVLETIAAVPTGFSDDLGATDVPVAQVVLRSVRLKDAP